MQSHIKSAAMTVAIVLVGIYIARKVPMLGGLVDTALNG